MDTDTALLMVSITSFFAMVLGWIVFPSSAEAPSMAVAERAPTPA